MSNTSFNDLTNQLAQNLSNPNNNSSNNNSNNTNIYNNHQQQVSHGSGAVEPLPPVNMSQGMRGYSRSSKNSHASRRGIVNSGQITRGSKDFYAGVNGAHPNTAGSQKRQNSISNDINGVSLVPMEPSRGDDVYKLPQSNMVSSKRSALNQQQNLEYVPLSTVSYASQRNQQSTKNMAENQRNPDSINQEYYSQAQPGENGSIQGKREGQSQGEAINKKDSSLGNFSGYAPLRTELSTQENMNNKFNDILGNQNGISYTDKSKSNISLGQTDKNQSQGYQQQNGSDATAYSSAIRTTAPGQGDYKIGKLSKYSVKLPQHQNERGSFGEKRLSNHYTTESQQNNAGSSSRFMLNRAEGDSQNTVPNMSVSQVQQQNQGNIIHEKRYQLSVDQSSSNRKMSLAAKSGQMQIFNSLNAQTLSKQQQQQQQQDPSHDSVSGTGQIDTQNYETNAPGNALRAQRLHLNQKQASLPPHPSQNKIGSGAPINKNGIMNQQNVPFKYDPNSNQMNTPLGSRQFESYLGRRQVIQQQRQEKQELLKQLEMGGSRGPGHRSNVQIDMNESKDLQIRQFIQQDDNIGANPPNLSVNGVSPRGLIRRMSGQNAASHHGHSNSIQVGQQSMPPQEGPMALTHPSVLTQPSSVSPMRGVNGMSHNIQQRGPNPLAPGANQIQQNAQNGEFDSQQQKRRFRGGVPGVMGPNQHQSPNIKPNVPNTLHIHTQMSSSAAAPLTSGQPNAGGIYNLNAKANIHQEFTQYLQQQLASPSNTASSNHDNQREQQIQGMGISGAGLGIGGQAVGQNGQHMQANREMLNSEQKREQQRAIQAQETNQYNQDLQKITQSNNQAGHQHSQSFVVSPNQPAAQPTAVNSRITRKLEGGRPHKVYDYMFIQMSNEQFMNDYQNRKVFVEGRNPNEDRGPNPNHSSIVTTSPMKGPQFINGIDGGKKQKYLSPSKSPEKNPKYNMNQSPNSGSMQAGEFPNLNGLVQIKAYDNAVTDELPSLQCNLLPTQLDHLKVLVCEQDDFDHPKLTPDAQQRFEIEKQNQIKQYMDDIIGKLQQKDRKFKVTVKKKFIDDALYNSTSIRVASVYVIVVNREKTIDPQSLHRPFRAKRRNSPSRMAEESSSEENDASIDNTAGGVRRSANPNFGHSKKRSMYDSDTNDMSKMLGYPDTMNSTSTSTNIPQFKKLVAEKGFLNQEDNKVLNKKRSAQISTGPNFKRQLKKEEDNNTYRYVPPVKTSNYGKAKIRVIQDIHAHDHHLKHPINIFSNQYNEFIKLIFKNAKKDTKFNVGYAMGLSKAIGLNLKKDAFSEQNLKSREYLNSLKEKLIFLFWKKICDSNADLTPGQCQQSSVAEKPSSTSSLANHTTELELEAETIDSSSNQNNTPKSKNLTNQRDNKDGASSTGDSHEQNKNAIQISKGTSDHLVYPPSNIIYKYFIGKGNNSIMVRSLFKNRFWWVQNDKEEMEKCNFCWTQIKKQSIMDVLPCKFPNKKSGIKNSALVKQNLTTLLATPQSKSSKKKKAQQINSEKVNSKDPIQTTQDQERLGQRLLEYKLYNKIEDNFHLNNKKALFLNMKNYYEALDQDVFDNLPVTFHVKDGLDDPEFQRFKEYYEKTEEDYKNKKAQRKQRQREEREQKERKQNQEHDDMTSPQGSPEKQEKKKDVEGEKESYYQSSIPPKNIWIIKPGENTNQGKGIQVAREFNEIRDIIEDSTTNRRRTCIVQKYIYNPLLINRRKFDIRTYVLMSSVNGNVKVYLYEEGYLRTSCREFSINDLSNKFVHLTNDAVQKKAQDYGKFEAGNKISYNEFQQYIDKTYPNLNICFDRDIRSQMNKISTDIFRACHGKLDPKRRLNCMEVFGLDFMIDDEFKPYLIEVNTNPCLELSSPLLARLIPNMLENALKVALDPTFLPPEAFSTKKAFIGDAAPENRFELVFDSKIDGPILEKLFQTKDNIIIELDEDELSDEEEHDDEEE